MTACDDCLRRAWLLGALTPHLDRARRRGGVLGLGDDELIDAVAGKDRRAVASGYRAFDVRRARQHAAAAGLHTRCVHAGPFPAGLLEPDDPPAAIFVAGRAETFDALAAVDETPAVAIVGARRCAGEGEEVAQALGQGLATAGVCVVSGMALGIDSAAHRGALAGSRPGPARAGAPTIAVLAGGADVVYPPSGRALHQRILTTGCAISEMPPGTTPRKWSFPARNRIIAALAQMTVVVQARERSGSLITADLAMQLGRCVGAVPGPVTRALSQGTNALLHDGAHVVRDAQDILDAFLPGRHVPADAAPALRLEGEVRDVLAAVEEGAATAGEIAAARGLPAGLVATALTRLELYGLARRDPAGRYSRTAGPGRALL
jgi:DNA processing protein